MEAVLSFSISCNTMMVGMDFPVYFPKALRIVLHSQAYRDILVFLTACLSTVPHTSMKYQWARKYHTRDWPVNKYKKAQRLSLWKQIEMFACIESFRY